MKFLLSWLFFGFFMIHGALYSQEFNNIIISRDYKSVPLADILNEWSETYNINIYYKKEWLAEVLISEKFIDKDLQSAFDDIFNSLDLDYLMYDDQNVVVIKTQERLYFDNISADNGENTITIGKREFGVTESTLTGYIKSAGSTESLIGATVFLNDIGTVTDTYGFYSFTVPPGNYTLRVKYLGWQEEVKNIQILADGSLDIELYESVTEIDEVIIRGRSEDSNVTDMQMSSVNITLSSIKEMPALLGEVDVYRTVLQLPGVSTVGEGSSGVNVRGGDVQENLILIDNIPLYSSSHVFGFFSSVNADLIDNFRLIKGGISPKYGGRTSAVLQMDMKSGDRYEWKGKGAVSNLSSKLTIEGPIVKDKASIIIGGRFNYSDYLLKAINDPDLSKSSASFHDVGTKLTVNLDSKNRLSFISYYSGDEFKFADDTTYHYSSFLSGIDWVKVINDHLSTSLSLSYSTYNNNVRGMSPLREYRYSSGISSLHLSADAVYTVSASNHLELGLGYNRYSINPGKITPEANSLIEENIIPHDNSHELTAYVNENMKLTQALSFSAGIRFTQYQKIGQGKEYFFEPGLPMIRENITDTIVYANGEKIQTFNSLEPRLAVKYILRHNISLKASYQRSRQFLHQLNNSVALSPFAIWRSSGINLLPQTSDQWAMGYFQNMKDNTFESSVEFYYRKSKNVVEYKNMASLVLNGAMETQLLPANAEGYGMELFFRKQKGRLKGWLSYTYSRSFIRILNEFPDEAVNRGKRFPSNFDKPNILSTSLNYELSRRWVFAGNFSYSTGRPISFPTASFSLGGVSVVNFSERNQYRIPDYHRLDLSLTLRGNLKKDQKIKTSWTFGIYNVYGRNNPFTVFFGKRKMIDPPLTPYQMSVIAQPIPSVTLNIYWN